MIAQEKVVYQIEINPYISRASSLAEDKKYLEAAVELHKALGFIPEKLPSRSRFGVVPIVDSSFVASICWNLSYYQVLAKDFTGAIETARKGMALDKKQALGIQTNLVLGLLLSGRTTEALDMYLRNIGERYERGTGYSYWENTVVEDLEEIIEARIQPELARSMIDTIIATSRYRAFRSNNAIQTNSVAIRGKNNRFLKLNTKAFDYVSPKFSLDQKNKIEVRCNLQLPASSITASSQEIGELETFDLIRVPTNPKRNGYLNRSILSVNNQFMAVNTYKLSPKWTVEGGGSDVLRKFWQEFVDTSKSFQNFTLAIPSGNKARVQNFELLPVNASVVRFRDNEGHYLKVDTTFGVSTLSMSDEPTRETEFELVNLDGSPFQHGLQVVERKKEKYELSTTFQAIAPTGEVENLIGRGYTEEMKDCGIVVDTKDTIVSEYGLFNKFCYDVRDRFQLSANVGMILGNLSAKYEEDKRYLILQAYNISKVVKLNQPPDIEKLRQQSAKVFISKVYYGWALNYVVQGDQSSFSGQVAASIKLFDANLNTTITNNSLTTNLALVGFKNNKFMKNAALLFDEVKILAQGFTPLEKPVPIFVEYTVINEFDVSKIDWK
ncbi:MAG: hypothetical protein MUF71_01965 [Candidatus Kapabacteria bacterium]|nr:hypothetical protein [Candidatus Kapabacteria bacterium]